MKHFFQINKNLLQAFIYKTVNENMPVKIQRGETFMEGNGTEMENVVIEYRENEFDFNKIMGQVITEFYNLK